MTSSLGKAFLPKDEQSYKNYIPNLFPAPCRTAASISKLLVHLDIATLPVKCCPLSSRYVGVKKYAVIFCSLTNRKPLSDLMQTSYETALKILFYLCPKIPIYQCFYFVRIKLATMCVNCRKRPQHL